MKPSSWLLVVGTLGALIMFALWYAFGPSVRNETTNIETPAYEVSIDEDSTTIFSNETALFSYVEKFGPKETIVRLNELTAFYGSCHDAAHKAGRFSYEIYGDASFKECSAECHSGCYHGATEAYFKDHGTANLEENLRTLCSTELNPFFSHQCIHGIGHGLMAWSSYEIFDALDACDLLTERQDSCWTGVFMENIVGSLGKEDGHFTNYLSDDPLYPCNDPGLEDKYKSSCYFLQTSRMMQLFGGNFKRIADACMTAPQEYRMSCFGSMGRDAGGSNQKNPLGAIAACAPAKEGEYRVACLNGAAQDSFWDPSGKDNAIKFCTLLTDKAEKAGCYTTIFSRAPNVLSSQTEIESFCAQAESPYQAECRTYIK